MKEDGDMPKDVPHAIERAWASFMAGDMDAVLEETRYVDGAWRALGGLALILKERFGGEVTRWMDLAQVRFGGLSPRQYLRPDDPATWQAVTRSLRPDDRNEFAQAISDAEHPRIGRQENRRSSSSAAQQAQEISIGSKEAALGRLVIVAMEEIHGLRLAKLIATLKESEAIDLRHAVRFDLPGTSRRHIFSELEKAGTAYIRAPVEWHRLEIRPMATDTALLPARFRHKLFEQPSGHLLVLVPRTTHQRFLASTLNLVLSAELSLGWRIQTTGGSFAQGDGHPSAS